MESLSSNKSALLWIVVLLPLLGCGDGLRPQEETSALRACGGSCDPIDPAEDPAPSEVPLCGVVCDATADCSTECQGGGLGSSCFEYGSCAYPALELHPPRVTQISAGNTHTCAVRPSGALVCWGDDSLGMASPPDGVFASVSVGGMHSCAVKLDGTVVCWGNNSWGESTPPVGRFTSVSVGPWAKTCGVLSNGKVRCWGQDSGAGETHPPAAAGTFVSVVVDEFAACGLKTDHTIACWGNIKTSGIGEQPVEFYGTQPTITDFVSLDGDFCGLRASGAVFCWFRDFWSGTLLKQTMPGLFRAFTRNGYGCGIRLDGSLECLVAGQDRDGLGHPPAGTFLSVSTGTLHACAVQTDDKVVCWGSNLHGQATPKN